MLSKFEEAVDGRVDVDADGRRGNGEGEGEGETVGGCQDVSPVSVLR